ncbi:MAG: hypothetical protein WAK17_19920 [Candidatus Nitrosopolaris sp.]|jgi:hypothetical protein
MDYDKLSKDILDLDSKIRFVGVCDESGVTRFGGQREGVKNILSSEESKKSNLQAMARWGLRNSLAPKVGKGKYAMAEYENIKRISFPLDIDHVMLVTTEVTANHMEIINSILKRLQD